MESASEAMLHVEPNIVSDVRSRSCYEVVSARRGKTPETLTSNDENEKHHRI